MNGHQSVAELTQGEQRLAQHRAISIGQTRKGRKEAGLGEAGSIMTKNPSTPTTLTSLQYPSLVSCIENHLSIDFTG